MVKIYIRIKSVWLDPCTKSLTFIDEMQFFSTVPIKSFEDFDFDEFLYMNFWFSKKWDKIEWDCKKPNREIVKIDIFIE